MIDYFRYFYVNEIKNRMTCFLLLLYYNVEFIIFSIGQGLKPRSGEPTTHDLERSMPGPIQTPAIGVHSERLLKAYNGNAAIGGPGDGFVRKWSSTGAKERTAQFFGSRFGVRHVHEPILSARRVLVPWTAERPAAAQRHPTRLASRIHQSVTRREAR